MMVKISVECYCPECGSIMLNFGTEFVRCVNFACPEKHKNYKHPTINLEPVESEEK